MCWTPLSQNNTNNVNKTRALIQTTGGKDVNKTRALIQTTGGKDEHK